jgi:16S rRNA (cytosine967-C5)-methyltransferase
MTPAARAQAAIELLDQVIGAAQGGGAAADTLIARYFKTRRYAGAKDRRAVRDLVYAAIRRTAEAPVSGRAALLGLAADAPDLLPLFDGSQHGPAPVCPDEEPAAAGLIPHWLQPRLDPLVSAEEWPALLGRAPLDLRVNLLRGARNEALAAFPEARPTPFAGAGLRLPEGSRVEDSAPWRTGLVEVQDEGSQLVAEACRAGPGETVVDLCAGAGGKALALAAGMAGQGRLVACDTDRGRLSHLPPRRERAGAASIETRLLDPGREAQQLHDLAGAADLVLVDAPCSGSGTWRRNPETRWRLTERRLALLTALQARILDVAVPLLRPGGRLVYAVCSLLGEEGRDQAQALSARSSLVPQPVPLTAGRSAGAGRLLTPAADGTDGFFVACWQAPC